LVLSLPSHNRGNVPSASRTRGCSSHEVTESPEMTNSGAEMRHYSACGEHRNSEVIEDHHWDDGEDETYSSSLQNHAALQIGKAAVISVPVEQQSVKESTQERQGEATSTAVILEPAVLPFSIDNSIVPTTVIL